jgi:hypothetical protein
MSAPAHPYRRRAALVLLLAASAAGLSCRGSAERPGPLSLYVSDADAVKREVVRYKGHALDPAAAERIEQAARAAQSGDYRGAAALLEKEIRDAAVPSLHTNLGVLYAALGDAWNAHESFQAALRIDPRYRQASEGLDRLKVAGLIENVPVTREVEPNNSSARHNRIALDSEVAGEVKDFTDIDTFRFAAPRAPRDWLEITVASRSALTPYVRIRDVNQNVVLWNGDPARRDFTRPETAVAQSFSPEPEAAYYLEVWGKNRSTGAYTVRVKPLKAYDAHEPNDDLLHATAVQPGGRIEAAIMDARDSDYYAFAGTGSQVSFVVENRSATLVPAVSLLGQDKLLIGFGPEVRQAGANLTHSAETVPGRKYYLQVWGRQSGGAYTLVLK